MNVPAPYAVHRFDLSGLQGISDRTLEMHFKLYEGYVKQTNRLNEEIAALVNGSQAAQAGLPSYAELKRRLGFECNGMVLHEFYFDNLTRGGSGDPAVNSAFRRAAESGFGSFEAWKADFSAVGNLRGVGWAICYLDPRNGRLSNHWITMHEVGHVAGFVPLLVMDVWEHAFLLDHPPAERPKYIDAFFQNVNWRVVEDRLAAAP